jgi:hypothetical protein
MLKSKVLLYLIIALAVATSSLADWQSMDIGDTAKGSTEIKGEEMTIVANGADIWGAADACRYVYREVTGDFEMSVRIVSLERANEWSKAGIMARQNLDPGSQHTFVNVTPDHGLKMIHRDTPGSNTGPSPWAKNFEAPVWMRLVRKGDEFSSFASEDGKNWEPTDVVGVDGDGITPSVATVIMTDPILLGIAHTSHAAGVLGTAVIDNITGSPNIGLPVEPAGSKATAWGEIKEKR